MLAVLRGRATTIALIVLFGILGAVVGAWGIGKVNKRIERNSILPTAQPMAATVELNKKHVCSGLSPAIAVQKVPETATRLSVLLTDLNFVFDHGGGTIAVPSNGVIAEGALTEYFGPCPDEGDHTYRFRVNALDEHDKIVGIAETTLPCCSQFPEGE